MKEVIPQKAGKASHLLTNIIIIAFCIGIAYFLASFVTNYVAYQTPVEGESMEPTLTDGDSVVIQRLSYYFTDPKRYDVVVFPVNYDSESQEKTYYIKRVIGLPGETVQIIDGSVYINNEKLTDDKYSSTTINEAGIAENPLVLGENQYFVMGDNRNMSTDSRNSYVGLVNKNDIVGEAWICTWPLTHFGGLK
ncbi:MAG: signal peptidase I [Clostridium sp. 44_14]|nr:signal peptidase I [Clostridium sp.]OKZ84041.1 MAG: signal peptidase I [Clostridium sp. 44_14]RHU97284.1 signal peptidase I [Clostridium sp. OM07-9AC]RHV07447.1 signal peptidase I [Clostridium sp. OM07-10AC]